MAFEVDQHGNVARWSLGAQRVLGYAACEVIGRPPPVPAPWGAAIGWGEAGAKTLVDQPVVWQCAQGNARDVMVSTSPAVDWDGRLVGLCVSARYLPGDRLLQEQLAVYARDVRESYGRELHRLEDLQNSYRSTVEALAVAVEAKDGTTGGHIRRVSRLGQLLANAHLGVDAEDPQLGYGFLLHDIGKLAVPDAVLGKPGSLNDGEWDLMRQHPDAGARILAPVPFLDGAIDVVRYHHERWDGHGYPSGRHGDEIPIGARIFSIVDTVDAMTSDRPYRAAMPLATAISEVVSKSGTQFDPACVKTFAELPTAEVQAMLEAHEKLPL